MRLTHTILLLILFSCSQKKTDRETPTRCDYEKQQAIADYQKGIVQYVNRQSLLRYESELKNLLEQKGIKYQTSGPHGDSRCYGLVMDSLIKVKYGVRFLQQLKISADSLFFETRKDSTFSNWQVDTWALRKNSDDHLGGDYVIDYLNQKLGPGKSFSFVSNTVGRPHYVIVFTVDKNGATNNVEIRERINTDEFKGTEEFILNEVTKINGWIPATIKTQPVAARFQMGVAMESR